MAKKEMKISENSVVFDMDIARDSFALAHRVRVTVDITGVEVAQLAKYAFSGASVRVKLQSQLRKKTELELNAMALNGLKTTFKAIDAGSSSTPVDKLMLLSLNDFVKTMVEQLGLSVDQATTIYNRKHGIVPENEELTEM